MKVFNTEMELTTLVSVILQFYIVVHFSIEYLKTSKPSGLRFLNLTIYLLIYNIVSGLLPNENYKFFPMNLQMLLAYAVGVGVALYYVYYIYKEFHIKAPGYLSLKVISIVLISSFLIILLIPTLLGIPFNDVKHFFLLIPIILGTMFLYNVSRPLQKLYLSKQEDYQKHLKHRIKTAYIALLCIVQLPIINLIGNFQIIEQSIVNVGYFILTYALIKNEIFIASQKEMFLESLGYDESENVENSKSLIDIFETYNLTKREKEIAKLILQNFTYVEIGETLNISPKTVSKHASNIFSKAGFKSRDDFKGLIKLEGV